MKLTNNTFLLLLIFSIAYSNNSDSLSISKGPKTTDTAHSSSSDSLLSTSKSNYEITDTTYKCTVITNSKNKYPGVQIIGLNDSSVKILTGKYSREILINDIRSIKFSGRGFWRGAAFGGGAALLGGFLLFNALTDSTTGITDGFENFKTGMGLGVALAIPFAIIGGLISQKDKYYDLRKLDFAAKRKKVKELIEEYSTR